MLTWFPHQSRGHKSPSACCCGYGKRWYVAECTRLHCSKSN
jgi:hypothetical protein